MNTAFQIHQNTCPRANMKWVGVGVLAKWSSRKCVCSCIRQGQELETKAHFLCDSVNNFPCYSKKLHCLLEAWSVLGAPGKCFLLWLFIPQIFGNVLRMTQPSLHLRLEKYSLGFLGITASINYWEGEAQVSWKLEPTCSLCEQVLCRKEDFENQPVKGRWFSAFCVFGRIWLWVYHT